MNPCLCTPSTEALTAALRAVAIPRREIECKTRRQEAVSEYLQTPNATHLLITDCVVFETDDGKLIPAYQVYKHPARSDTANKKSNKNDQAGTGFRYYSTGRNILHRPEPLGLLDTGSTGSRKIALLDTQT
jgi:hypothetical protein